MLKQASKQILNFSRCVIEEEENRRGYRMGFSNTAVISHVLEQKGRKELLCRQPATFTTVILIIVQNGNMIKEDPRQKSIK